MVTGRFDQLAGYDPNRGRFSSVPAFGIRGVTSKARRTSIWMPVTLREKFYRHERSV